MSDDNVARGRVVAALRGSRHTLVLSGSGISAESGIPTFRDAQTGLWARFRPEDLATPEAFERDPALVWQWYQARRERVAEAKPNAGHLAIAALERLLPRLTLVTQNVDGLHQRAGSSTVLEFHGNILRNRCAREGCIVASGATGGSTPPRCPGCGAFVRPDVVWFGEAIPRGILIQSETAAGSCDVFLSIGTSSLVEPAASLAHLARRAGAIIVEVNPQDTPLSSSADIVIREPAGSALPAIVAALG